LQIGFDIVKQKNLSSLQRLTEKGFVYTERDMFCQNIPANLEKSCSYIFYVMGLSSICRQ